MKIKQKHAQDTGKMDTVQIQQEPTITYPNTPNVFSGKWEVMEYDFTRCLWTSCDSLPLRWNTNISYEYIGQEILSLSAEI
jgi:hypothetical protein